MEPIVHCAECGEALEFHNPASPIVQHKVFDSWGELEYIELAHRECRPDWAEPATAGCDVPKEER